MPLTTEAWLNLIRPHKESWSKDSAARYCKNFQAAEPDISYVNNGSVPPSLVKKSDLKDASANDKNITDTSNRNILTHAEKENDAVIIQSQLARKNKTIATYDVSTAAIKVELYDNGEIDGDTVTVYHNKQKIIDRQVLGINPIVFSVKADAQNRVHEFILVANNLGRIPPIPR